MNLMQGKKRRICDFYLAWGYVLVMVYYYLSDVI